MEEFARVLGEGQASPWLPCPQGAESGRRSLAAAAPPSNALLLHYVGYGFSPRGVPWELVGAICDWKIGAAGRRLVTLFHEVYAFGPPWRSSFWLSPVQRHLAQRLARVSDACVTSTEPFAAILRRWVPAERVHVLPVFSTIGEPEVLPPWGVRTRRMIVFGSPGVRERAYQRTGDQLSRVVARLEVEEVLDVGASAAVPGMIAGVPVRSLGHLPPEEVGRLLGSARFGFVAYPPHLLGKSSIFAAYEAHGLCPVVGWPDRRRTGAKGEESRWLAAWALAGTEPDSRAVAEQAVSHYVTHALARHAELHRRLLAPCAS